MKITGIETRLLAVAWDADPNWAFRTDMSTALIRVDTDEGVSGWGETIMGYFAPQSVPALVDFYKPVLIGEDPRAIDLLWRKMYNASIYWGRTGAGLSTISGIEMALWDLNGKLLNAPVWQLLGGKARDRVRVYASGGGALWPMEATVKKVRTYKEMGYGAAKVGTQFTLATPQTDSPNKQEAWVRMGAGSTAELAEREGEKFRLLRKEFGSQFELLLDGHQGARVHPTSTMEALRICQAIEPYGILLYEEPLSYLNVEGYAELRRRTTVPISGGESLAGMHEFQAYFDRDALDIVQPDVSYVGGIGVTRRILDQALTRHHRAAIHTGGAAGPGFAASLHLSVAHDACVILEQVPAARNVERQLIADPLDLKDGSIAAPTLPGLGLRITEEFIQAHPLKPDASERTRWLPER
jgi:L-alanine-DL-glutamate epimerase-like enolase superfamily enzyme